MMGLIVWTTAPRWWLIALLFLGGQGLTGVGAALWLTGADHWWVWATIHTVGGIWIGTAITLADWRLAVRR